MIAKKQSRFCNYTDVLDNKDRLLVNLEVRVMQAYADKQA